MSSAPADAAVVAFLGLLAVLLAASLVTVIRLPAGSASTPVPDAAEDAEGPVPATLPHRAAGQSGLTAPSSGQHRRGGVRPAVTGGPPWGAAPRPPDLDPWA